LTPRRLKLTSHHAPPCPSTPWYSLSCPTMPSLGTPHRGTQHQNRNSWSTSEPSPTTPRHAPAGCGAPLTLPRKGRNMRRARRRPRRRCRCSLRSPPRACPGTGTNLHARPRRYWHSGRHPPQRQRHQRPHLCAWYSHQRPHNWCRGRCRRLPNRQPPRRRRHQRPALHTRYRHRWPLHSPRLLSIVVNDGRARAASWQAQRKRSDVKTRHRRFVLIGALHWPIDPLSVLFHWLTATISIGSIARYHLLLLRGSIHFGRTQPHCCFNRIFRRNGLACGCSRSRCRPENRAKSGLRVTPL